MTVTRVVWQTEIVMPIYQEQYNTALPACSGIGREFENYTTELDRDWKSGQSRNPKKSERLWSFGACN